MGAPLATDFTGPLYVVLGVGAVISLTGLAMVIAIWLGWAQGGGGARAAGDETGAWKIVKEIVEWIFKSVPQKYRFPVALIFLGALIMVVPIVVGLMGDAGNGSAPGPTGPSGPSGSTGTTTGG